MSEIMVLQNQDYSNNGVVLDHAFELYRSALINYDSKIKSETIPKPVSNLDILQTVFNLMGSIMIRT